MIRFYAPDILSAGILPEDESGHCVRVLRMREGSEIETVDGCGHAYTCRITDANPRGVLLEILEQRDEPRVWNGRLRLAVAPTKNADRMEWLAEKAVELGVDEIILLRCEHSERKTMRLDRLRRVMISAMKQSLKAHLPELRGPISLPDFFAGEYGADGCRVIGYCSDEVKRCDFGTVYHGGDLTVLIGPEGDFSPCEVRAAMEAGYKAVTFGRSRLRTETAALYAVTAFHVINNLKSEI